ncbi:GNAT family N-acetyltransferase [Streptomyces sp. NPDC059637]|uniref:GNAT family N-acetyltransferase n=1 Tax=Streptomyces sp. NPDC059637 TaxID=3347752 RepID=UPI00367B0A31
MVLLRVTSSADLDALVSLESAPDTSRWLGETGRAWHEQALADPDQEHLTGEVEGAPVGFAVLSGVREGEGLLEIRRIVVSTGRRGTGHGRALLRGVVAHAYERLGARRVRLDVKARNTRALALYRSEGFVAEGTLLAAVPEPDGSRSDLVLMAHARRLGG